MDSVFNILLLLVFLIGVAAFIIYLFWFNLLVIPRILTREELVSFSDRLRMRAVDPLVRPMALAWSAWMREDGSAQELFGYQAQVPRRPPMLLGVGITWKGKVELPRLQERPHAIANDVFRAGSPQLDIPERVNLEMRYPILLQKKRWYHEWAERLGVLRKWQTGNAPFEKRVAVQTSASEGVVSAMLASPVLQEKVLELLDGGWDAVLVGDDLAQLSVLKRRPFRGKVDPSFLESALQTLREAARTIPHIHYDKPEQAPEPTKRYVLILSYVAFGVFVLSIISALRWQLVDSSLVWYALVPGLLLWLGSVLPVIRIFRWKASSLRYTLVSLAILLLVLPAATVGLAAFVNAGLDTAPAKQVILPVMQTTVEHVYGNKFDKYGRRRDANSYVVSVPPLPGTDSPLRVEMNQAEFNTLLQLPADRRYVSIPIHEGVLGFRWVGKPHMVRPEAKN